MSNLAARGKVLALGKNALVIINVILPAVLGLVGVGETGVDTWEHGFVRHIPALRCSLVSSSFILVHPSAHSSFVIRSPFTSIPSLPSTQTQWGSPIRFLNSKHQTTWKEKREVGCFVTYQLPKLLA